MGRIGVARGEPFARQYKVNMIERAHDMTHYTYEQIGLHLDPDEIDPELSLTDQASEFGSCMNDRTRAHYAELGLTFDATGVTVRDAAALDDAELFARRIHFATDWVGNDPQDSDLMKYRTPYEEAIREGHTDANKDLEAESYLNGDDDVDYGGSYVWSLITAIRKIIAGG